MISAVFLKKSDKLVGFDFSGHAGYAESGEDIICAATSALVINTVNSIEEFTEDDIEVVQDEEAGAISLTFTGEISDKSELLLKSLLLGIKQISEVNDEDFLKLEIKEV